jgi:hypothetical protein
MYQSREFRELTGKTIVEISGAEYGSECIKIRTEDGKNFQLKYYADCCASASVEDVCGDIADLVGSPILMAEEVSNSDSLKPELEGESFTWTFYKLATIKGSVTIRWFGSSNGYYSESATFEEVTDGQA